MANEDMYLKLEGVKGEGKDGSIEIDSWSWGASNASADLDIEGTGSPSPPVVQSFQFYAAVGEHSPQLLAQLFSGPAVGTVQNGQLTTVKLENGVSKLTQTWDLNNYAVSAYLVGGHRHGSQEQFTLDFESATFTVGGSSYTFQG